jgi:hypothetical protein
MYIHNICGTTECGMESLTSQKGSLDFSEVVQGEFVFRFDKKLPEPDLNWTPATLIYPQAPKLSRNIWDYRISQQ